MAVAFRSKGTAVSQASGGTFAYVADNAGLAVGDLMVAIFTVHNNAITITATPSGWSATGLQGDTGADADITVYWSWKIATSGDIGATHTWTLSGSTFSAHGGGILAYSGADTTTPIITGPTANVATAASSQTTPSITPGADNCIVICAWGLGSGSAAYTLDATLTSRYNASLQTLVHCVGDITQGTAAAISKTSTWTGGQDSISVIMAVQPTAGPPPVPIQSVSTHPRRMRRVRSMR